MTDDDIFMPGALRLGGNYPVRYRDFDIVFGPSTELLGAIKPVLKKGPQKFS
jgi:hypothetical protein